MNIVNESFSVAMTLKECATRLSISKRHLQRLISSGSGPEVKRMGRSVRITNRALEAFLAR